MPGEADEQEFLANVAVSEELHAPWVSAPADSDAFRAYLDRAAGDVNIGFLVRSEDRLAGVININNVVMGAFRSASLGYYAFKGSEGQGLMAEALELTVAHAFTAVGLHRLEANIQPGNVASIRLVGRAGFVKEGFSEKFLLVRGEWRDHERWAITEERIT